MPRKATTRSKNHKINSQKTKKINKLISMDEALNKACQGVNKQNYKTQDYNVELDYSAEYDSLVWLIHYVQIKNADIEEYRTIMIDAHNGSILEEYDTNIIIMD